MLAYVFWHRPADGVATDVYERALVRFQHSLSHQPPAGLLGSATLRAPSLPWLAPDGPGYEDWYLVEGWSALGVLESAAVSPGHESAHREAARRSGAGEGGVYRLIEGDAQPADARLAVWVTRPPGRGDATIAELLDDGVAPGAGSLWQRSLVLGPAPEFCLLLTASENPPDTGVGSARLPAGWTASPSPREAVLG